MYTMRIEQSSPAFTPLPLNTRKYFIGSKEFTRMTQNQIKILQICGPLTLLFRESSGI